MSTEEKPCEGIYFLSLSLENVRCFGESQMLDLSDGNGRPAQWTVILGDNGVGKTTLLEVLAGVINSVDYDSLHRIGSNSFKLEYKFAYNNRLENKLNDYLHLFCDFESFVDHKKTKLIPKDWRVFKHHIRPKSKIYIYSASRRIRKDSSNSLISEDKHAFIDAEKWLQNIDYIASKKSEIQKNYKKLFGVIKNTLIELLPDISDIRISEPSEKFPNPKAEFKTPDGWLHLSQLSLGYQTMTAWMVDFAARMFEAYPNSSNPIAEPAVVLIDEIDLHLHPKWQRTIMSYLSERFINTQFIVTAHSPLIVQAAEQANIVVLKRQGDSVTIHQQEKDVQGWRIDQLLTSDLFDLGSARSPFYENKLAERRQILSKPELTDEDQAQLKILEAEIGDLPTAETAEDIAAMDIIRRAAELLKKTV